MRSLGITRFILITSFLLFSVAARFANAGTYYVSPSGSAAWSSCSVTSSPCSVPTALANAVAGDTVLFLAGTYSVPDSGQAFTPGYNPSHSGTSGNPITFKANPGAVVTIDNNGTQNAIGADGRNYIVWDGFIVDCSGMPSSARGGGAVFNACNNGTLKNCTFIGHTTSVQDNNALIRLQSASYILIQNNTLKNQLGGNSVSSSSIQNFYSTHNTIEHNEIYNCGVGVDEKDSAQYDTIRYNLIHDVGIGIHGPGNASSDILDIYQNIFYNVSNTVLDIEKDWPNSFFHNNTIYNSASGIGFWSIVTSTTKLTVYNNIFHTTGTGSGRWVVAYHAAGLLYDNYNNFYNSGGNIYFENNYSNVTFPTWKSQTGFDANSINTDPLFVNTSGHDFHLQASSPARTAGRGGSFPSVMGGYITGNEIIGPTSSTRSMEKPSAPLGLIAQ